MNAGKIKEFLATQDIIWNGKYMSFQDGELKITWPANLDKPLEQTFLKVLIDGKEMYKHFLITNGIFMMFDEKNEMPEKDFSRDWQVYQSIVEEQELNTEHKKQEDNIKENI